MKKILFLILVIISIKTYSQVEIKIMQYNILYYGLETSFCTSVNNNLTTKNNYLKTIVNYVKPDILSVNEISADVAVQDNLLNNVFLLNGYPKFKRANKTGSYLANQIYYNSEKLTLKKQEYIEAYPRQFDVYKFYYNSPDLLNGDTAFFVHFVGHLESSQGNEASRASATQNLMATIDLIFGAGNYVLSGDFNLYTNAEPAYQNLINYSNPAIRFYDPVNQDGVWHENENYVNVHTQSSNYYSGCPAGGGLDDRFDFIMLSNNILNNSNNKITYVENSYKVIGQDGNHFNDAVNYGTNTSVPTDVLNALFGFSDHLPVTLKLKINQNPIATDINNLIDNDLSIIYQNPVYQNLDLKINLNNTTNFFINNELCLEIYDIVGKKVFLQTYTFDNMLDISFDVSDLESGIYIFKIKNNKTTIYQNKFVKL